MHAYIIIIIIYNIISIRYIHTHSLAQLNIKTKKKQREIKKNFDNVIIKCDINNLVERVCMCCANINEKEK